MNKDDAMGRVAVLSRVGLLVCGIPVEHVTETMRALPIEPLAGAPPFVRGVSVVRGSPVPVLDAARIVGQVPAAGPGMFVGLRTGGRAAVLAVDAVVSVTRIGDTTLEAIPPLLRDASEVIAAIGTLDSSLLLVLSAARLAPAPVWAAFDAVHPSGALA